MQDKKKIAAMLVMGLKPKAGGSDKPSMPGMDDSSQEDGQEGDEPDDLTAAKEVMDSIKMGDVKGFLEGFKALMKLCDNDDSEGDSEEEG